MYEKLPCPICQDSMRQVENDYDNNEKQVVERMFGLEEDIDTVFQYTCKNNHRFYLAEETVKIAQQRIVKAEEAEKAMKEMAEAIANGTYDQLEDEDEENKKPETVKMEDLTDEERENVSKQVERMKERIRQQLGKM